MSEGGPPSFYGEKKEGWELLFPQGEFLATESIDLDQLLPESVTASGSFDLRGITEITLARLWDVLPLSILLVDPAGTITYVNRHGLSILGKGQALLGELFAAFFPDRGVALKISELLMSVHTCRKPAMAEGTLERAGKRIWARVHLRSLRFKGKRFIMVLLEDLSAEKAGFLLTRKYEKLVQVTPVGIAEFALATPMPPGSSLAEFLSAVSAATLVGGNHEFAAMNGFSQIQEARGVPLNKVFPLEGAYEPVYRKWIRDGFPRRSFETKETNSCGALAYFDNALVGNTESGILVGIWAMRKDITERKMAEEALKTKSAQLAEYSQSLESVVAERTRHLEASQRSLEDYARKLEAANEALRVLIDGVDQQKREREKALLDNLKLVARPLLDQLRLQPLPERARAIVSSLDANLEKVASCLGSERVRNWELLTLREIRICEMIASGLSSKEIAEIMQVSPQTIFFHRTNIRKKLGLSGLDDDLARWLHNPDR